MKDQTAPTILVVLDCKGNLEALDSMSQRASKLPLQFDYCDQCIVTLLLEA